MQWDGTFSGGKLGAGVYVYLIQYTSDIGEVKVINGDITLIM